MRFLRWPIARAVPSLDPLSRDRARAYVRSAKRGWKRRLLRWVLVVVAAISVYLLWATAFALVMLVGGEPAVRRVSESTTAAQVAFFSCIVASMVLVAAAFNRWMVIRSVRVALAARGTCKCGYTIAGQSLNDHLAVRCPECGVETSADAELGEVEGEGTEMKFRPRHPSVPRLVTKKRVIRLAGASLVLFFAVGFIGAAWWGVNKWRHARDAKLAAQERPTPQQLLAFVLAGQPAGSTPGEDGYTVLRTLLAQIAQVEATVRSEWPEGPTYGDYSMVEEPIYTRSPRSAVQIRQDEETTELALRYLRAHAQKGTWETMKRLAACRGAVRPLPSGDLASGVAAILPEMASVRQVARINAARMRLAIKSGDAAEFADALEANLALSRILALQPTLIDRLVSLAIESMTLQRVRSGLAAHPEKPWLDRIDQALSSQRFDVPLQRVLEGERLFVLDTVAAGVIARVDGHATGRSAAPASALWDTAGVSWWENGRDAVNEVFDSEVRRAALERSARPVIDSPKTGFAAVDLLLPSLEKAISSNDQTLLERRGLATMVALERYRLAHGVYPDLLSDLVPAQISELPLDPWSGKPFGYRRVVAAAEPQHRGYLLWSVGMDGADNGGAGPEGANSYRSLFYPDAAGTDFILNDLDR